MPKQPLKYYCFLCLEELILKKTPATYKRPEGWALWHNPEYYMHLSSAFHAAAVTAHTYSWWIVNIKTDYFLTIDDTYRLYINPSLLESFKKIKKIKKSFVV